MDLIFIRNFFKKISKIIWIYKTMDYSNYPKILFSNFIKNFYSEIQTGSKWPVCIFILNFFIFIGKQIQFAIQINHLTKALCKIISVEGVYGWRRTPPDAERSRTVSRCVWECMCAATSELCRTKCVFLVTAAVPLCQPLAAVTLNTPPNRSRHYIPFIRRHSEQASQPLPSHCTSLLTGAVSLYQPFDRCNNLCGHTLLPYYCSLYYRASAVRHPETDQPQNNPPPPQAPLHLPMLVNGRAVSALLDSGASL